MPFIVFVDQLGTRAKWHEGGPDAALAHFARLEQLIADTLDDVGATSLEEGAVESDSAVLIFSALKDAFSFARALFRAAFEIGKGRRLGQPMNYLWLRGVVLGYQDGVPLRKDEPLAGRYSSIKITRYARPLLDAIAAEKSSFKGMRLLIRENQSLTRSMRRTAASFKHRQTGATISPFVKLPDAMYPGRLAGKYFDFLWMLTDNMPDWHHLKSLSEKRLHFTAGNPEEFLHAAATRTVFYASVFRFTKMHAEQRKSWR